MTHKNEILALQAKARRAGRLCNLIYSETGALEAVAYIDRVIDPLSFAEREREAATISRAAKSNANTATA